jgi:hypothetical protein
MTDEALQGCILAALYIAHFERGEAGDLGTLAADLGVASPLARSAFRCLHERHLARCHAIGGEAQITTSGILDVEQRVLVPSDLIERQRATRARILDMVQQLSAGRVVETCRRIWFRLPTSYVDKEAWLRIHGRLCTSG